MARALLLDSTDNGVHPSIKNLEADELPSGDTLVEVLYSSLNFKDGLAVTGRGKIIRAPYPFVPGIDLAGRVLQSDTDGLRAGDLVVGTGWGLGEMHWGGYSELQRLDGSRLVRIPEPLDPRTAMVVGTAGLTAMLSVMALEEHGAAPRDGEIVVTGSSGGVGSMAVALLSAAGYEVVASTGSNKAHEFLRQLGAARIIHRDELAQGARRPMDSARWAGAVDVVGGSTLAAVISQLRLHASVAACGLAGGHELHTTVYPFILRGVNLLGIDSNTCPHDRRVEAWGRIAQLLRRDVLDYIQSEMITLEQIPEYSERILDGRIQGRIVVDVKARKS